MAKAEFLHCVLFLPGNIPTTTDPYWITLTFYALQEQSSTCFSVSLLKSLASWHSECYHTIKLGVVKCGFFFFPIDQVLKPLPKDTAVKVCRGVGESLSLLQTERIVNSHVQTGAAQLSKHLCIGKGMNAWRWVPGWGFLSSLISSRDIHPPLYSCRYTVKDLALLASDGPSRLCTVLQGLCCLCLASLSALLFKK